MLTAAFREYLKLRKSQWWKLEESMNLQWRRTKAMIAHAYENVPFYTDKFDRAGIKPGDIRSQVDLTLIPTCTKTELRQAQANGWQAKNYRLSDCVQAVTSGSTGSPLKFYLDERSLAFRFALNLRTLEFSNYRLGKKLFQVSPPLSGKLGNGMKTKLLDIALRRHTVSPFEPDIDNKMAQLIDYRPDAIVGYTSYIKSLADLARDVSSRPRIESIMTTSEKLLDRTRLDLSDIFGGQVFDQYGSVETGRAATECIADRGYHINTESVFIEIVDKTGKHAAPGETGEVLVTNLMNYVNPFIRYRIGDTAALLAVEKCSCGRESPRLKEVGGRLNDVIRAPDGRKIMPEYFYLTLREIDGLRQFQIIQTAPNGLKVLYAKDRNFDESKRADIEAEYAQYLAGMDICWETVDNIATINGKHHHIVALDA